MSFEAGYIADFSAVEALNKLGERYGAVGKTVKLQELKPASGKILRKSAGLLVKEVSMRVENEEQLSATREHMSVEHFGVHQEHVAQLQQEMAAGPLPLQQESEDTDEHA